MPLKLYVRLMSLAIPEEGSVAAEYGLLLGIIAALLIGAMIALRGGIDAAYRTAIVHLETGG